MPRAATDQSHNLTLSLLRMIGLATIFFPLAVLATVVPQPSVSCLSCDGEATLVSVFPGLNTYEWYASDGSLVAVDINGNGTHTVTGLCPGVYQAQWTNGDENDAEWFSIGIPGDNAGDVVEIARCTGSGNTNLFNQLEGDPVAGGTWSNPLGQVHTGVFNPSTSIAGFYIYTVEVNGCVLSSGVQVEVIQNADPGLSTTYLICETYSPFFLTDVLAGSPDYGGQWFNSSQEPIDGFYYPETDVTGLFTYMIDTVAGCPPVFSTMFIIENQLPDPGLPTEIAVCPNAVAFNMTSLLNGTPDAGGTWVDNVNSEVDEMFDPLTHIAGTYEYVVQGLTPCPNQTATLTISFTDGISAGSGSDVLLCSDAPDYDLFDALSGDVTQFGIWTAPNGVPVSSLISPATALVGNYMYSVEAVGCQPVSSVVNFQIEQAVNAGSGGNYVICETNDVVTLSALLSPDATAGGIWQIGANEISGTLAVEGGQTYNLTYTVEGAACGVSVESYIVQVDNAPEVDDDTSAILCTSLGAFDLHSALAPTVGFSDAWIAPDGSVISSLLDLSLAENGVYVYEVYSNNTCANVSSSVTLTLTDPQFTDYSGSFELCYSGGPLTLADFIPFDLPVGGIWTNEAAIAVEPVLPESIANTGIYTYTIPGDGVCGDAAAVVDLTLVAPLTAGVGGTLNVCSTASPMNAAQQLDGASAGGEWLFNGVPATELMFDPANGLDGIYTYVVPAIGPCPTDSSFIEFYVEEGFAYSAGEDQLLCWGDLPVQLGMEGCGDCVFSWTPALGLDDPSSSNPYFFVPEEVSEGAYQYTVEASNGVCTVIDEVEIVVHPQPELSIAGPSELCYGTSATWVGSGALELQWTDIQGAVSSATNLSSEVFTSGTILLNGTNEFGCQSQTTLDVEVLFPSEVYFDIPPLGGCSPLEVPLTLPDDLTDDATYYWTINGVEYSSQVETVTLAQAGIYDITLHALAENGCSSAYTLDGLVEVYPVPFANFDFAEFGEMSVINTEVGFVNTSSGAIAYSWDFGGLGTSSEEQPTFDFPPVANQGYRVCLDVVNTWGCSDELCRELYIQGEMLVYVPNAFTPDFDGVNDGFRPIVEGIVLDSYDFSIYNRWGELIFKSNDPMASWYGQVRGGDYFAQDGAYIWILEMQNANSAERLRFEGHVSLIR